jgi:hypothetical protein
MLADRRWIRVLSVNTRWPPFKLVVTPFVTHPSTTAYHHPTPHRGRSLYGGMVESKETLDIQFDSNINRRVSMEQRRQWRTQTKPWEGPTTRGNRDQEHLATKKDRAHTNVCNCRRWNLQPWLAMDHAEARDLPTPRARCFRCISIANLIN